MSRRTTIRDVASRAGVSISSVSRYLADPSSIRNDASLSISEAIKELDYTPNPFARNLKTETTRIIAVILPDISDRFFSEACKAICTVFYENKYSVMICDTENDPEKERFYVDEMIRNRVAGIMLVSCGKNTAYLRQVVKKWRRLILFDRLERGIETDVVSEDNVYSGYLLANYMLSLGHRRFAVLGGAEHSVNRRYRFSGIKKACGEYGVTVENEFSITNLLTRRDATNAVKSIVEKKHSPRCILACNTILLEGAMVAAYHLKLAVPAEYAIAGFCVDDPRDVFPFPVPAVIQIPAELGKNAAQQLLKRITSQENLKPVKQLLRVKLVC